MKILVINTASDCCFVSLINGDKTDVKIFESFQKTSECLLPEIDKLLRKNKLVLNNLDSVAVCVGPGSFTGIRVGLATVKAFNFAINLPIISFNIFECFNGKNLKLIKANSGGAYSNKLRIDFLDKEKLEKLKDKKISVFMQEKNYFVDYKNLDLQDVVKNTNELAIKKFNEHSFSERKELCPIYVLKSQAENELEEKLKNVKVKKLSIKDVKEIKELEDECFSLAYSSNSLINELQNNNHKVFGLLMKEKIIGYCSFCVCDNDVELERVCIVKKYRNLQLAEKLLSDAFKKLNPSKCFLEVNKKNDYAIKLYIKLGFVQMGIRRDYYAQGEDALTMQKVF